MKPLLSGDAANWRNAFYYHYYGVAGAPPDSNWIAGHEIVGVRTRTAKLVCYPTWKGGPFWEYFDLTQDPHEMHNLHGEPSRQEEVAALKARFRELAAHYKDMEVAQWLDAGKKAKP
jgi:arylsulfatase A-like enzyme